MRKGIVVTVLAAVLAAAPVLAAQTTPAPEGAAAPAKPGKAKKKAPRRKGHSASHGAKSKKTEGATPGTEK